MLPKGRRGVLIAAAAADFLVVADGFSIAVAIPAIQGALGFTRANVHWVVSGYVLTFGGFLLVGGRLADDLGRRSMLLAGAAAIAAGAALSAVANAPPMMIAGRAMQGLGAAAMAPAALALLSDFFQAPQDRNTALAAWSAISSFAIPAGALVGGVLTAAAGWRSVMWANAAFGLAVAATVVVVVPPDPPSRGTTRRSVPSACAGTAGIGLLVLGVGDLAPVPAGAGLVALCVFLLLERSAVRRGGTPVVDWSVVRHRGNRVAQAAAAALPVGLGAVLVVGSQRVQGDGGLSPAATGVLYAAVSVPVIVASPLAERVMRRVPHGAVAAAGMLLQAGGLATAAVLARDAPASAGTFAAFAVVGAGAPLAFIPVTAAALHGIGDNAGSASGLLNTVQQLGNAVGLAVVSAAMTAAGGTPPGAEFRAGFLCAAFLCAGAALLAGRLGTGRCSQAMASGTPRGAPASSQ